MNLYDVLLAKKLSGGGGSDLPAVTTDDNGKVMTVVEGAWDKADVPAELPAVTGSDNGKFLGVANGAWGKVDAPSGGHLYCHFITGSYTQAGQIARNLSIVIYNNNNTPINTAALINAFLDSVGANNMYKRYPMTGYADKNGTPGIFTGIFHTVGNTEPTLYGFTFDGTTFDNNASLIGVGSYTDTVTQIM